MWLPVEHAIRTSVRLSDYERSYIPSIKERCDYASSPHQTGLEPLDLTLRVGATDISDKTKK
ncbi:unnamed protein product [Protopolystoma xenopodis]|uniref:Uncharacterized protein n=1 Tax=Protopolystoma xenopodis TaxID=117903 RepID=A0A3S5CL83_9PLAT|nr:unnamed protein product [Protopolystoma xenopodis]